MSEAQYATCAFCPNLCRHVCPVAVATAFESATPTSMMTAAWRVEAELGPREVALAATTLCLGCGACEAHCKLHVPVPSLLEAFRGGATSSSPFRSDPPRLLIRTPPPSPENPLPFTTCWDGPASSPNQLACCGRRGGFAEREPEAARAVAVENVRLFAGRTIRCADADCAAWLREHGAILAGERDD